MKTASGVKDEGIVATWGFDQALANVYTRSGGCSRVVDGGCVEVIGWGFRGRNIHASGPASPVRVVWRETPRAPILGPFNRLYSAARMNLVVIRAPGGVPRT